MSTPTLERPSEHASVAAEAPGDVAGSDLVKAVRLGAALGIPVMLCVVGAVSWLAAPGQWWLLGVAIWPALFAGWYFGAIVVLGVFELRDRRRARRARRQPSTS